MNPKVKELEDQVSKLKEKILILKLGGKVD